MATKFKAQPKLLPSHPTVLRDERPGGLRLGMYPENWPLLCDRGSSSG